MSVLSSLCFFLALAASSMTLTSALIITVPAQVQSPGSIMIHVVAEPGDPSAQSVYTYTLFNNDGPGAEEELVSAPSNATDVSLNIPVLAFGGSGWGITAAIPGVGFDPTIVVGTSKTFSVLLPEGATQSTSPGTTNFIADSDDHFSPL
ncbi:hypothetical protein B0H17DRAFT_1210434 [Mycena rosella]|uniref:Uncharacterized protein n=1 Tax=Mycena rosella TaxID=1033263 RepID=A0AAD7CWB6_MYCRO|nr:hypothetical protein B0H17DRAFT_1210434 [Mycena rosella]